MSEAVRKEKDHPRPEALGHRSLQVREYVG